MSDSKIVGIEWADPVEILWFHRWPSHYEARQWCAVFTKSSQEYLSIFEKAFRCHNAICSSYIHKSSIFTSFVGLRIMFVAREGFAKCNAIQHFKIRLRLTSTGDIDKWCLRNVYKGSQFHVKPIVIHILWFMTSTFPCMWQNGPHSRSICKHCW